MAKKIKVNISGEAFTGKIVTFKAPCDCTEATGLVIGEDTYDVVDALGNCITGSYLAWRSGALVSVALDVDSKKAFLQNEKPTPAALGAYSLIRGAAIPSNADLDTYTTPGSYICQTTATAGSLANSPVTTTGFSLHVEIVSGASSNYLHQTLRVNNATADVWKRRYHPTSGWGEWDRFATASELPAGPTRPAERALSDLVVDGITQTRKAAYFRTEDGVVTFLAELNWKDGITGDSNTICTMPEGFRPRGISATFPATWWFNKTSSTTAKRVPGTVQISPEGVMVARIIPTDIPSGAEAHVFIFGSYVAAE